MLIKKNSRLSGKIENFQDFEGWKSQSACYKTITTINHQPINSHQDMSELIYLKSFKKELMTRKTSIKFFSLMA